MTKHNKIHQVWMEGFSIQGQELTLAQFMGFYPGETFEDAARAWDAEKNQHHDYGTFEIRNGVPTVWGCRLYDNEEDARRLFG